MLSSLLEKYKKDSFPKDASSIDSYFKNYLNERENIRNLIKLTSSEGNDIIERSRVDVSQWCTAWMVVWNA